MNDDGFFTFVGWVINGIIFLFVVFYFGSKVSSIDRSLKRIARKLDPDGAKD